MKLEKCEQERKISPECCRVTSRGSTHTCTAGSQYRSQQEEMLPCILKWHYFTTTTSNRKPDNSSTNERLSQLNEKPLHFELPVSSNGLFVYNSPSQLPLLLYKSFLLKKKKSLQAIYAGQGVEKREPSYTIGGMQTSTATMENSVEIP